MRIGIVGFSGAGRSTLFTAFSGQEPTAPSGNPLTHRSTAMVRVPDERLEWLRDLCQPRRYTPAAVEFVDFAGVPRSAEKGKAELFEGIRDADALVLVVSGFTDAADAMEVPGTPLDRVRALEEEFLFANLERLPEDVEPLWPGPWAWAIYEVRDVRTARECHARGARYVETMAVRGLLHGYEESRRQW